MAGSYYRYKRLKRYSKRNTFSPYILFMLLSSCVIVMSIGYASLTSFLTIQGNVNAQYATYTITYDTRGGTNPNNAVTQFSWGDNIPLPIPTRTDYNFEGWYDEDNDQLVTSTNGINKDLSVYATWSQAVLPTDIFVTLYTDGTLAFDNTNATIPGKTVENGPEDITNKKFQNKNAVFYLKTNKYTVTSVTIVNPIYPVYMDYWFYSLTTITSFNNMDNIRTQNCTSMINTFYKCNNSNITSLDLSSWDVSNVTSMRSMFSDCQYLSNLNISTWETSSCTDMYRMFYNMYVYVSSSERHGPTTLDLRNFDITSTTNMQEMFRNDQNLSTVYVGDNWVVQSGANTTRWITGCANSDANTLFVHVNSLNQMNNLAFMSMPEELELMLAGDLLSGDSRETELESGDNELSLVNDLVSGDEINDFPETSGDQEISKDEDESGDKVTHNNEDASGDSAIPNNNEESGDVVAKDENKSGDASATPKDEDESEDESVTSNDKVESGDKTDGHNNDNDDDNTDEIDSSGQQQNPNNETNSTSNEDNSSETNNNLDDSLTIETDNNSSNNENQQSENDSNAENNSSNTSNIDENSDSLVLENNSSESNSSTESNSTQGENSESSNSSSNGNDSMESSKPNTSEGESTESPKSSNNENESTESSKTSNSNSSESSKPSNNQTETSESNKSSSSSNETTGDSTKASISQSESSEPN